MRLVFYRGKFCIAERVDGNTRRTSLRTSNRAEAERRFADYKAALTRKATTVGEILDGYIADHGPRMAAPETAGFAIRRLKPSFGALRPDQVTRADCRAYVAKRHEQGVGDGTIRRELTVLRAALHWADKHTSAQIEMPSAPAPKARHLTREEYRVFREASKEVAHHLYVFVVLAYTTAGRASAILDLTWDRVDFERGQIRLGLGERRSKGRATVPMTDGAREVLLAAKEASVSDYVVEYAGRKVSSVKRAFKSGASKAGLPPDVSPHWLRHSAAVRMAENGVPMGKLASSWGIPLQRSRKKFTHAFPAITCVGLRKRSNVRGSSLLCD
jgi:integrase